MLQISGTFPAIAEYTAFSTERPQHERNKGEHRIHIGPDTPSHLILPFVSI